MNMTAMLQISPLHLQVNSVLALCRRRCESVHCMHALQSKHIEQYTNMCGLATVHKLHSNLVDTL